MMMKRLVVIIFILLMVGFSGGCEGDTNNTITGNDNTLCTNEQDNTYGENNNGCCEEEEVSTEDNRCWTSCESKNPMSVEACQACQRGEIECILPWEVDIECILK